MMCSHAVPYEQEVSVAIEQGTYDYVIVGAGPAGCVVAARLAQAQPELSILLIDAGCEVPPDDPMIWDPT